MEARAPLLELALGGRPGTGLRSTPVRPSNRAESPTRRWTCPARGATLNKKTGNALPGRSQEGITGNRAVSAYAEIPGFASPPRNGFARATDPFHPNKIIEKRNLNGGRCAVTRLGETQMRDHVGASRECATVRPSASLLGCLRLHVFPRSVLPELKGGEDDGRSRRARDDGPGRIRRLRL
jgi:hypothetical protein